MDCYSYYYRMFQSPKGLPKKTSKSLTASSFGIPGDFDKYKIHAIKECLRLSGDVSYNYFDYIMSLNYIDQIDPKLEPMRSVFLNKYEELLEFIIAEASCKRLALARNINISAKENKRKPSFLTARDMS